MKISEKETELFNAMSESIKDKLNKIKTESEKDLEIDDTELDSEVLKTPKLYSRYLNKYTDEVIVLKDFYSMKDKFKLERWKYYSGTQTDKYYAENGIFHEKILKSDIDKYLDADPKMKAINDLIALQKTLCDHIEKVMKEISNRNFHIKAAIEWRRFTSGGGY